MEKHNAQIEEIDGEHYLAINMDGESLKIPLTKDEPNEIKEVFNQLTIRLKKGVFSIDLLDKENPDIFFEISKEYIAQLNSELEEIHTELENLDLLDKPIEF